MTRSQQRLLSQLATSDNDLASGLGQCLEALRLISALPRASPVFVKYAPGTTKAFGREHLSRVPLRTVLALIKTSLALTDPIRVSTALFYREDGTVDTSPVLVDEDSWKELAPYVHTLHVEDDDHERPASALTVSTLSALSGSIVVGASNGTAATTPQGTGTGAGTGAGAGAGVGAGRIHALNSNASSFVPASNGTAVKTSEGTKASLLRKPSFSPSSPQPLSSSSSFTFLSMPA